VEVTDSDKHYSLLRYGFIYDRKTIYDIDVWAQCYKTFYGSNLRIVVIS